MNLRPIVFGALLGLALGASASALAGPGGPAPQPATPDLGTRVASLEARLTALESDVRALKAPPPPSPSATPPAPPPSEDPKCKTWDFGVDNCDWNPAPPAWNCRRFPKKHKGPCM